MGAQERNSPPFLSRGHFRAAEIGVVKSLNDGRTKPHKGIQGSGKRRLGGGRKSFKWWAQVVRASFNDSTTPILPAAKCPLLKQGGEFHSTTQHLPVQRRKRRHYRRRCAPRRRVGPQPGRVEAGTFSASICVKAVSKAASSSGAHQQAEGVFSGWKSSGTPPVRVATTGQPQARASSSTQPKVSARLNDTSAVACGHFGSYGRVRQLAQEGHGVIGLAGPARPHRRANAVLHRGRSRRCVGAGRARCVS